MSKHAVAGFDWGRIRSRFLVWSSIASAAALLIELYVLSLLTELSAEELGRSVALVALPVLVVGAVVPLVLLSGRVFTAALGPEGDDSPGARLTRVLELPRRVQVLCLVPSFGIAAFAFFALEALAFHRPAWLSIVGLPLGALLGAVVSLPSGLWLQQQLQPLALLEHRKLPTSVAHRSGMFWPRQSLQLPYAFALALGVAAVFSTLIVSAAAGGLGARLAVPLVGLFLILLAVFVPAAVLMGRQERRAATAIEEALRSIVAGTPRLPEWLGTDEMGDVAFAVADMSVEMESVFLQLQAMAQGDLAFRLEGNSALINAFRESQRTMSRLSEQMQALSRGEATAATPVQGDLGDAFAELHKALTVTIEHAKTIARGDLRADVELPGELGGAIQQMTANLRAIAGQTQAGGEKIGEMVVGLRTAASQLSSAITEQVSALTETANTMTEMAQTSAASAERASELIKQGESATDVVDRGQSGVREAGSAIGNIANALGKVAGLSGTLALKVQQVDTIIETVGFLADQSSTLAINAAIEASRAGEQGRGFAAVAREMRALASDSRKATGQIREILSEIRQHTGLVDSSVSAGSATVDDGVRLVESLGEVIGQLGVTIQDTVGLMRQVEGSARQHQAGVNQVTQALRSMQTASESIRDGAKMLTNMSEQTHELAGSLKTAAGQYHLSGGAKS